MIVIKSVIMNWLLILFCFTIGSIEGKRKDGTKVCIRKNLRNEHFWNISKNEFVSKDCQRKCRCNADTGEVNCQDLCPPSIVEKLCIKYVIEEHAVSHTTCKCHRKKCLLRVNIIPFPTTMSKTSPTSMKSSTTRLLSSKTKTGLKNTHANKDKNTKQMHERLEFIIPMSLVGAIIIIILVALIVCRCCPCLFVSDEKNKGKKSRWSMMLRKRPLPKLPPEAKHKEEQQHQAKSQPNVYEKDDSNYAKYGPDYTYPDLSSAPELKESSHYQDLELKINDDYEGVYEQIPYQNSYDVYNVIEDVNIGDDNVYMGISPNVDK